MPCPGCTLSINSLGAVDHQGVFAQVSYTVTTIQSYTVPPGVPRLLGLAVMGNDAKAGSHVRGKILLRPIGALGTSQSDAIDIRSGLKPNAHICRGAVQPL